MEPDSTGGNIHCWSKLELVTTVLVNCMKKSGLMVPHESAVLCRRRSRELLEKSEMRGMLEVSPSDDVMRSIPARAIRGVAEQ